MKSDIEKFKEFLEMLSEKDIYKLLHEELFNAEFREKHFFMLENYIKHRKTLLSEFENKKVKKANEEFDAILKKLFNFY